MCNITITADGGITNRTLKTRLLYLSLLVCIDKVVSSFTSEILHFSVVTSCTVVLRDKSRRFSVRRLRYGVRGDPYPRSLRGSKARIEVRFFGKASVCPLGSRISVYQEYGNRPSTGTTGDRTRKSVFRSPRVEETRDRDEECAKFSRVQSTWKRDHTTQSRLERTDRSLYNSSATEIF